MADVVNLETLLMIAKNPLNFDSPINTCLITVNIISSHAFSLNIY